MTSCEDFSSLGALKTPEFRCAPDLGLLDPVALATVSDRGFEVAAAAVQRLDPPLLRARSCD